MKRGKNIYRKSSEQSFIITAGERFKVEERKIIEILMVLEVDTCFTFARF